MVIFGNKFLCGEGCIAIYYCDICCKAYATENEAKDCETSHKKKREDKLMETVRQK